MPTHRFILDLSVISHAVTRTDADGNDSNTASKLLNFIVINCHHKIMLDSAVAYKYSKFLKNPPWPKKFVTDQLAYFLKQLIYNKYKVEKHKGASPSLSNEIGYPDKKDDLLFVRAAHRFQAYLITDDRELYCLVNAHNDARVLDAKDAISYAKDPPG